MIDFVLGKWKYLKKEFGTYHHVFIDQKGKMQTHYKNKKGRMGFIVPRVKAKWKHMKQGRRKTYQADGPEDFLTVYLM